MTFVFPPEVVPDDAHPCRCGPDYAIGELIGWCGFCFGTYEHDEPINLDVALAIWPLRAGGPT